ncbi:helix-hairpin-helix domain-containing protein [Halovenus rubra]|uniref:Helix-hairpin-helix domain-containing protein n=2 Tax=Halovenus rubra TaxID=869890 RepID=A0ABD5X370_9EURY|nr:helix-hairpin-helix domain-containing protein [Halovenus rubra]
MSAKSLIQKIKQVVGLSDKSESEPETGPSTHKETDVTVEREPEPTDKAPSETNPTAATPASDAAGEHPVDDGVTENSESVENIKGIGPTYSERLDSNGLGAVPTLAESDAETVAKAAQTSEGRAKEWIKRARNR